MNTQSLFAGLTDTPLTDEGRQQARHAGQQAKGLHIDLILSSPLVRAHETAQLFAQSAGLDEELIETESLLLERDFGTLENTPWISSTRIALLNDNLPEGVESWDSLLKRSRELLDKLDRRPEANVLLVAHGSIGRALRSLVDPEIDIHARIPNSELVRWI